MKNSVFVAALNYRSLYKIFAFGKPSVLFISVVYSADGSHGIWPNAGRNVYKKLGNGDELVDYTGNGLSWDTWQNVKWVNYRRNKGYTGEFTWLNFDGRWGNPEQGCGLFFSKNIFKDIAGECRLNNGPGGPQRGFMADGDLA